MSIFVNDICNLYNPRESRDLRNKAKDEGSERNLVKILAFDTSSSACSVALQCGDEVISEHHIAPMQQAKEILPMIQTVLNAASLSLHQLDAIAYGAGPGSFTGTRIASSVAQGLAFVVHLPVIAISSLAALAQTAQQEYGIDAWLIVLDARMEQIYAGFYVVNSIGQMTLVGKEQLCTPNELMISADQFKQAWNGVGDGWEKYGEKITTHLSSHPQAIYTFPPNAIAMLALAKQKWLQGEVLTAREVSPVYLR